MLRKIISGGQSGADTAGLAAARKLGLETGGIAPPGWVRHDPKTGQKYQARELLEGFGLTEGAPDPTTFRERTIKNVHAADATAWFGRGDSPGGRLTLGTAHRSGKPWIANPTASELREWLEKYKIQTLNVAGNREHTNPGIHNLVESVLSEALGGASAAIFVFGSNREGRHGAGAALTAAERFGARHGQAEGRQGGSYAIVTKELRDKQPKVTLDEIRQGVERFKTYATQHPKDEFNVTAIGTGLAGFKPHEIAPMFQGSPANVTLPPSFRPQAAGPAKLVSMHYKMPPEAVREGLRQKYPKGTSTMELIEQGERTATTRSYPLGPVGERIRFREGGPVYEITHAKQLWPGKVDWNEWSRLEGWDVAHVAKHLKDQVKPGAWQTIFKKIAKVVT